MFPGRACRVDCRQITDCTEKSFIVLPFASFEPPDPQRIGRVMCTDNLPAREARIHHHQRIQHHRLLRRKFFSRLASPLPFATLVCIQLLCASIVGVWCSPPIHPFWHWFETFQTSERTPGYDVHSDGQNRCSRTSRSQQPSFPRIFRTATTLRSAMTL